MPFNPPPPLRRFCEFEESTLSLKEVHKKERAVRFSFTLHSSRFFRDLVPRCIAHSFQADVTITSSSKKQSLITHLPAVGAETQQGRMTRLQAVAGSLVSLTLTFLPKLALADRGELFTEKGQKDYSEDEDGKLVPHRSANISRIAMHFVHFATSRHFCPFFLMPIAL